MFKKGLRCRLGFHNWKMRPHTISLQGAEIFCTRCAVDGWQAWTTHSQVLKARLYLQIKASDRIVRRIIKGGNNV